MICLEKICLIRRKCVQRVMPYYLVLFIFFFNFPLSKAGGQSTESGIANIQPPRNLEKMLGLSSLLDGH